MSKLIDLDNPTWLISISAAHRMGSDDIVLNRKQAEEYNKDPEEFEAKHIGVSKDDYLKYLESYPDLKCTAITKSGNPCKNIDCCMGGAKTWIRMYKTHLCPTHQRAANVSRNSR